MKDKATFPLCISASVTDTGIKFSEPKLHSEFLKLTRSFASAIKSKQLKISEKIYIDSTGAIYGDVEIQPASKDLFHKKDLSNSIKIDLEDMIEKTETIHSLLKKRDTLSLKNLQESEGEDKFERLTKFWHSRQQQGGPINLTLGNDKIVVEPLDKTNEIISNIQEEQITAQIRSFHKAKFLLEVRDIENENYLLCFSPELFDAAHASIVHEFVKITARLRRALTPSPRKTTINGDLIKIEKANIDQLGFAFAK